MDFQRYFRSETVKKNSKIALNLLLVFLLFLSGCRSAENSPKEEILVYCAASLTDVITEITRDFESGSGVNVNLNLASSGTLARQIEMGATPDLYISANREWLDYLGQKEKLEADTKTIIAQNTLVLIAPATSKLEPVPYSSKLSLPALLNGRFSIGDPQHVPAGNYAIELLNTLGWLEELQSGFLPAKDVRSALMVVELSEAEAGIVYKTDALKSDKVKIITEFPDSLYSPVTYNMGIIKGQKNDRSLQLYNYIVSEKMLTVWKKYGFKI